MNKVLYSVFSPDGQGNGNGFDQKLLHSLVNNLLPGIQVLKPKQNGSKETVDFKYVFSDKTIPGQDGKPEGKFLTELFPSIIDTGLHELFIKLMKTGEVLNEIIHLSGNGQEGWIHLKIQRFDDGLIISREDITALKKHEKQNITVSNILKEAEKLSGLGSWEYDIGTTRFTWSDGMYRLFEMKNGTEITPDIYLEYTPPEERPFVKKIVNGIKTDYSSFEEVITIVPTGKERKFVRVKGAVLRDINNKPIKVIGVDLDITDQLKAEERIFELNRDLIKSNRELAIVNTELQTFNSIAANDYKETLKQLYTNLEYIVSHDALRLSDAGKANLRRAQAAIQRMKLLTEDIVTYSAIHSLGSEIENVELSKILDGVRQDLGKKMNGDNVIISCESLPVIKAYPVLLSLLFQHILDNAIKFRKEDGDLTIKIHCTEVDVDKFKHPDAIPGTHYALITIQDNGIGFEHEHKEDIFTIFHKLHGKKYRGSGIGLAISKKIMDMNGGFITAESEPGVGTTIKCYFPQ